MLGSADASHLMCGASARSDPAPERPAALAQWLSTARLHRTYEALESDTAANILGMCRVAGQRIAELGSSHFAG